MPNVYDLVWPLLRCLNPETAHGLAIAALKCGFVGANDPFTDPILKTTVWGRAFPNPVGLAAGFDKSAEVPGALLRLGFGFVEVGSVTPRPQAGNERPRLFRLTDDKAVVNRLGFNNDGEAKVCQRLVAFRRRGGGLVGVNLGKNKETAEAIPDYVSGAAAFASHANYLVVNVSSPNTPGLRALQDKATLARLVHFVYEAVAAQGLEMPPPLLVKVAPDLTAEDKANIAAVVSESPVDGLIATNTTIERPPGLIDPQRDETGGLSGKPLFAPSTRVLAELYELTGGRLPLIGVGGVSSGADAYAKIRAGASLVQLYTGLVFHGPALVNRIKRELAALLKRDGFASVADAVGADFG